MNFPSQMVLPLPLPEDNSIGSFRIGASHQAAILALRHGLEATEGLPIIYIHGAEGCGKSHFGQAVSQKCEGIVVSADQIDADMPVSPILVCDALENIWGEVRQQTIISELINQRRQDGQGKILFLSRLSPQDWVNDAQGLADFASRMRGCAHTAEVLPPDDALLSAVLIKLARDRQFALSEAVVRHSLSHMTRDFASAMAFVQALDQCSLAKQSKVTIATARQALNMVSQGIARG